MHDHVISENLVDLSYYLHFIGKLKNVEHMIISLGNLSLVTYLWHMRFHMFHLESATKHISTQFSGTESCTLELIKSLIIMC
jgi:hypothetical protein